MSFRIALVGCLAAQGVAFAAPSVDEIVQHNLDARGGEAKMAAIHSLRSTGKFRFGGGDFSVTLGWGQLVERPGKIRDEFTMQGITQVDAYDGQEAWGTEPFEGRRDPQRNSADHAKSRAHNADFEGPLFHWKDKGNRVEYLGTHDVDGTDAFELRVTRKDGDITYLFLDPDSYLEIRAEDHHFVRGAEEVTEEDIGSYQNVAGVWFPTSLEAGPKGKPRNEFFTIEHLEPNVDVNDALFAYPKERVVRTIFPGKTLAQATVSPPATVPGAPRFDSAVISGLGARNIGSAAMSGRIAAVAGVGEGGKTTLWVGAASGGVWRSTDDGTTFKPMFDKQPVQSIGAIAVDPSNPKTVWVGTGEGWTRNSTSIGNGIYKSTDNGATWTHLGLENSERIVRIVVHPKDGDTVYACVPGKLWSDSPDRGVYRTRDGGKSWQLVLKGSNLSTGCSGLSMDPKDPNVLFAGMWDFRRKGWTFRSGGDGPDAPSGSGLFRTDDGGKTWTELKAGTDGLPAKPWGRVAVVVAPSDPKIVYALIESKDSALFRSSDGGKTWDKRDKSQKMVWRPFYFGRLVVDPTNPERLFKPDLELIVSEDGGKSFASSQGGAHGDWHDLWIDPRNPKHVVGGDDGGLWLSWDGGSRWWKSGNLPVSQFYHVAVDNKDPYQVYGGLQDNASWVGDSSYPGGITNQRWENLFDGDGFWMLPDPSDPDAVYAESQGGYIGRVDRKTHAMRDIQPKAGYHEKLRFNWNTPIATSPTDKKTLYVGAQFLFRSRDRGDTWERISPDLTTNDPEKQKQEESGGVTVDNSSAEMHTTIYSISESPLDPKTIWVGTDDGNLQLTRSGGKSWTNLTPHIAGLPANSWVSWVEASRFKPGTAYAAFDRHTFGDMDPWVYVTRDFGKTWTRIVDPGKGVRGYAHVIKEDTLKPNLLFLGTEFGLWISVNGGESWAAFKGGDFPAVAVRDLQVQPRDGDLVLATHGRGIWIIDDLTPLRALSDEVLVKDAAFLPGRPIQERMSAEGGWSEGDASFVGQNPPSGAVINYYQRSRHLYGPLKLEVLDAAGRLVDTLTASKRPGINRVTWNMQVKPPRVPRAATVAWSGAQGPRVLPGRYTIRLTKGSTQLETTVEVGLDRRAPYTVADRKAQFEAAMKAHKLFGDMSTLADRLEAAKEAAETRAKGLKSSDPLVKKLDELSGKLDELRKKIVATKEGGAITGEERIREHTDNLYRALLTWEGRPAKYQVERIDTLHRELDDVKKDFEALIGSEVVPINRELGEHKLEPIPTEATKTVADNQEAALWIDCALDRLACEDEPESVRAAETR